MCSFFSKRVNKEHTQETMMKPVFTASTTQLRKAVDFDVLEPQASINSSAMSKKARWPKNAATYFRVNLNSNHASSTSGGNTWSFQLNAPEEMSQGVWHMQVETLVMSGNTAATSNADKINDFHVTGLPLRDTYECTPQQDSTMLLSVVRAANTLSMHRTVTNDSLGVPLCDVGQMRQRRITVSVRNGDGNLLADAGLTHWRMVLVFYLLDD
jgi:hypothetical protein